MRVALIAVFVLAACTKDTGKAPEAKPAPTAPAAGVGTVVTGARSIAIEANQDGYVPAKIPGKPGEKLMLVFTRTIDAECLSQLKTPDGKTVELPLNKPVEVSVTVPKDGEVRFACGMDMFSGVVVAEK